MMNSLTNLGADRMSGTKLNFGSNEGWIAFEIKGRCFRSYLILPV